jgi:hypothetical protein
MAVPDNIILGDGVFSIGASSTSVTAIGLTKGGGVFSVEREYRQIEADGDYGPVKNRIRVVKEEAKLKIKQLEIVPANMDDYFPAMSACATAGSTTSTFTSNSLTTNITSSDYQWVQWVGYNKAGRQVLIALENAINLGGLGWDLIDKEEVVEELEFSATYLETARNTVPWKVFFTTTSSS